MNSKLDKLQHISQDFRVRLLLELDLWPKGSFIIKLNLCVVIVSVQLSDNNNLQEQTESG